MTASSPAPQMTQSSPELHVNRQFVDVCARASVTLLGIVAALGLIETIGWAFGIDWIKRPIANERAMPSGAAILFFQSAASMFCLSVGKIQTWRKWLGVTIAIFIGIASGATYLEHILERDWSLIYPLYRTADSTPLTFPGPMMPDCSFYFVLIAVALCSYAFRDRVGTRATQAIALLIGLPNLMIFLCYFCGMEHLCAYFGCIKFSPITSLTFVFTSFALLLANAEQGFTNIFVRNTSAGKVARKLCLLAVLMCLMLPLRMSLLQIFEKNGWLDEVLVNMVTAAIAVVAIGGFIAWSLGKFDTVESLKKQAEVEKIEAVSQLDSMINKSSSRRFKQICLECGADFDDGQTVCPNDGKPLSNVLDELKPGDIFAERYEIVRTLGAGGMSTVYLANHVLMNKLMAVKLLHDHLATDMNAVQRFQREAQTVTLLSHPNILTVHDFGLSPEGLAYLVMDYLDGASLQEYIAIKKTVHWQKASKFFLQLCSGLQHAHVKGIVHRDLKPGNVMLVRDENREYLLKIVDFGLAKICGDEASQRLTQTGEIFGSPLYMSPEQCQGAFLDHRSDIYAMGIIMYETLTGVPPLRGKTVMETFHKQISDSPPVIPASFGIPEKLSNMIYRTLSKDPDQRPQSAAEIHEVITSVLSQPVAANYEWSGPSPN
jgi:tRNA A-37 threonylcarbamoyl transferase component Bud32